MTQFITLAQHRTGSNLVQSLLNSHPNVCAYGEIFGGSDKILWGADLQLEKAPRGAIASPEEWVKRRNADPVAFIKQIAFGSPGEGSVFHARGFKLFYEHCWEGYFRVVWEWLESQTDIRIIHLKRINLLRALASRFVAQKTGAYHMNAPGAEAARETRVAIHPREARLFFERAAIMERESDYRFRRHSSHNLYYEDVAHCHQVEMNRVFEFLEVEPAEVATNMSKQNPRSFPEMIENYDELKKAFEDSRWLAYFTD